MQSAKKVPCVDNISHLRHQTHPGNCSANRLAPDMVSAVLDQLFLLIFFGSEQGQLSVK